MGIPPEPLDFAGPGRFHLRELKGGPPKHRGNSDRYFFEGNPLITSEKGLIRDRTGREFDPYRFVANQQPYHGHCEERSDEANLEGGLPGSLPEIASLRSQWTALVAASPTKTGCTSPPLYQEAGGDPEPWSYNPRVLQ